MLVNDAQWDCRLLHLAFDAQESMARTVHQAFLTTFGEVRFYVRALTHDRVLAVILRGTSPQNAVIRTISALQEKRPRLFG